MQISQLRLPKLVLFIGLLNNAFADTYIAKDANGVNIITNKPIAGANKFTVDQDVKDITVQINEINQAIKTTNQQKSQLDKAIKSSQNAINQANIMINKLENNLSLKESQLVQLQQTIPSLVSSVENLQKASDRNMNLTYQKINQLKANSNDSILSASNSLEVERQKIYMSSLLNAQLSKYKELNLKLNNLQKLSIQIESEVQRIKQDLVKNSELAKKHSVLINKSQEQSTKLESKILYSKKSLDDLKAKQAKLNVLMQQILAQEAQIKRERAKNLELAKQKAKQDKNNSGSVVANNETSTANSSTKGLAESNVKKVNYANIDDKYEDDSPFLERNLVKPIAGKVIVSFGDKRDGVRNNGLLISSSDNASIKSISNGNVMFSGPLPGFGQIVVIAHGDNYTAIYSGILPSVNKGDKVNPGSIIGSSGNSANQPMGGVYFELRRLGQPVNPTKIIQ